MNDGEEYGNKGTTQRDLLDAISGRRKVSIFLVDAAPAVKIVEAGNSEAPSDLWVQSFGGKAWRRATGEIEILPRGEYPLPTFEGAQQNVVASRLAAMAGIRLPKGLGLYCHVVVERAGELYLLHKLELGPLADGFPKYTTAQGLPESSTLLLFEDQIETDAKIDPAGRTERGAVDSAEEQGINGPKAVAPEVASSELVKAWTPEREQDYQDSVESELTAALAPQPPPRIEPMPETAAAAAQDEPAGANSTSGDVLQEGQHDRRGHIRR